MQIKASSVRHEREGPAPAAAGGDLVCLSHLRWAFVHQRPQHLMLRAARHMRVFFVEEPQFSDRPDPPRLELVEAGAGITVVRMHLWWHCDHDAAQRELLDRLLSGQGIVRPLLWFYTPRALGFAGHVAARGVVYDCMDELAAFAMADPRLPAQEQALLARADLVFCGGASLFAAKRRLHPSAHLFPSAVDLAHFAPARDSLPEPAHQAAIAHPRVGFYGVLDERLDRDLLDRVAALRPEVSFVLVGPLAKLDDADLPRRANLHYLPAQPYAALPAHIAHWQAAMMPFALNAATRFISPTKTPEYLAAGRPVVSTPIADVVATYGGLACVHVAHSAEEFARGVDRALAQARDPGPWRDEADRLIAPMSWDATWAAMQALIEAACPAPAGPVPPAAPLPCGPGAPAPLRRARYDAVVVGAGLAGATMAERLAAAGQRVLVVDRRDHLAGNAHDRPDAAGVVIHPYGPHIFHTNSAEIVAYLSRFTAWRPYEHRVLARLRRRAGAEMLVPMPINRTTINRFFGLSLREAEVPPFLAGLAVPGERQSAADLVLGRVGRALYASLIEGYSRKQWGLDPALLDASVTARLPVRAGDDDRYFSDRFQAMPREGFSAMVGRMLDHPMITVATATEWAEVKGRGDHLVFTGPVDEYFDRRFGPLPYRSLRFRHETLPGPLVQPVAVINEPDESVPHTRCTEFRHITGQEHAATSLCFEYASAEGDPYYPVPRAENAALYDRYRALADACQDVTFVGRLATYRYYNMDQVVGQALAAARRLLARTARAAE